MYVANCPGHICAYLKDQLLITLSLQLTNVGIAVRSNFPVAPWGSLRDKLASLKRIPPVAPKRHPQVTDRTN